MKWKKKQLNQFDQIFWSKNCCVICFSFCVLCYKKNSKTTLWNPLFLLQAEPFSRVWEIRKFPHILHRDEIKSIWSASHKQVFSFFFLAENCAFLEAAHPNNKLAVLSPPSNRCFANSSQNPACIARLFSWTPSKPAHFYLSTQIHIIIIIIDAEFSYT